MKKEQSHPKLYTVRREENNMNQGFDLDLSENIPEQIKKRAKPEKNQNMVRKVVTVDLVIMLHKPHLY